MPMRRLILWFLVIALLLPLGTAQAGAERILGYDSIIEIDQDSTMTVSETILVQSAGVEIKRGIFRDFPTEYRDRQGNRVRVDLEVKSVLRDGKPEPYSLEKIANGVRIRIGRDSVFLDPGQYTYTITYSVNRMIGYFEEHDELYWNVTGTDWAFPIDAVSARVLLPAGATAADAITAAYTGPQGSSGQDFAVSELEGGLLFATTRGLNPREGLTIVVGWPKGLVAEPTGGEKLGWFLRDNLGVLILGIGLLIVLLWYLFAWVNVGRDPRKGIIIPRYAPPQDISPAGMRYLRHMGFDNKAFTAAVINLAVQGRLTIQEEGKKFVLEDTQSQASGADEEEVIHAKLFAGNKKLTLANVNHTKIGGAIQECKTKLAAKYKGTYFKVNSLWLLPGIFLSTLAMVGGLILTGNDESLFLTLWLSMWTVGTGMILWQVRTNWRQGSKMGTLGMGCFSIPFVIGWIVGMVAMIKSGGAILALVLAGLIATNLIFARLLKAPTFGGRKIMDEIEGFRMFLEVAEKDFLQWSAPPERTPELFEKYLPHALALDVDQQWAEKFAGVLAASSVDGGYHPTWYHGRSLTGFSAAAFSSSLSNSFNSAVSSSSVAPGSSSGFSGGSSGGGGGGGGGGGW